MTPLSPLPLTLPLPRAGRRPPLPANPSSRAGHLRRCPVPAVRSARRGARRAHHRRQHHVRCRHCARAASVPTVRPDEPALFRATRTMVPTVRPDEPALPGAARTIGEHCAANQNALHTALAASRAEHAERVSKTEAEQRADVARAMAASVLPQGTAPQTGPTAAPRMSQTRTASRTRNPSPLHP